MAVPAVFVDSYAIVASPALAAETVVCSIGGVSSTLPGQSIKLHGWVNFAAGTDASACAVQIRKDSVSGTALGTGATVGIVPDAEGLGIQCTYDTQDVNENVGGAVYVLTLLVADASAVSTVAGVHLQARID